MFQIISSILNVINCLAYNGGTLKVPHIFFRVVPSYCFQLVLIVNSRLRFEVGSLVCIY